MTKYFIVCLLLILTACAAQLTRLDKATLLKDNLRHYQNFKWQGIIEAEYKSFAIRKHIIVQKNDKALRVDVFDSGIMGLAPQPFFSFYMDSTDILIKYPDAISAVKIDKSTFFKKFSLNPLEIFTVLVGSRSQEKIISENKYSHGKTEFIWNKACQLHKISNHATSIQIDYQDNKPAFIKIVSGTNKASISIDKITIAQAIKKLQGVKP